MPDGDPHRSYDDEEVGEIFSLAAEAQGATLPATNPRAGLTLAQLQGVGAEVGLAPERIAAAAAVVDARSQILLDRRFLGGPTRIGRSILLFRGLTEREWEVLAAELREAFGSHGRIVSRPTAHEWTDGKIHAYLEPTAAGERLRLEARRLPVTVAGAAGAFGIAAGLLSLLTSALDAATFGPLLEWMLPVLLVLVGVGAIGVHVRDLRRWADDVDGRMERVIERARALAAEPTAAVPRSGD